MEACNHNNSYCYCKHAVDHKGPHECECGGQWNNAGKVLAYPKKVVAEGQLKGVSIEDIRGPAPAITP